MLDVQAEDFETTVSGAWGHAVCGVTHVPTGLYGTGKGRDVAEAKAQALDGLFTEMEGRKQ